MNISEHVAFFEQEMKRQNYSHQTIDVYSSNLKSFFAQSSKDHPKNINETDIREFLGKFSEPNTQRSYHSAIKKFYEVCLGQKEKFKYIPYAKKSSKLPIVLSVEEVQRMFDACENKKHRLILALFYSCSLRVSELINLKWAHIDRSRMIINIIQAKGKKDRQVGLNEKLIQLMTEYYREYKSVDYVFNGQNGVLQYSERSVGEVVKQLATKAGINNKRVYTHLLRHTSATHLVEKGTDIKFIKELLGHNSLKTTEIYTHVSSAFLSKIVSPVDIAA